MSKKAELLSEYENSRLTKIATNILNEIEKGGEPNDVIYKSAIDHNLDLPFIQRICQTVNVGRSISLFKKATDRDLEFPIADAEAIIARLYQSEPKKAACKTMPMKGVSRVPFDLDDDEDDYPDTKPAPIKQADQHNNIVKIYNSLKQAHESVRFEAEAQKMAFISKLENLRKFFIRNPEKFEAVDSRIEAALGKSAKEILKLVYYTQGLDTQPRIKWASDKLKVIAVDLKQQPYKQIEESLQAFSDFLKAANTLNLCTLTLEAVKENLNFEKVAQNPAQPGSTPGQQIGWQEREDRKNKQEQTDKDKKEEGDSMWDLLQKQYLGMFFKDDKNPEKQQPVGAQDANKPTNKYFYRPNVTGPNATTLSPELAEYRALRASAVLHDMIAHDEVIGSADPELVTETFNNLVNVNPLLADQPLLLRNVIRKTILQSGVVEPYELAQLADVTKRIQEQDSEKLKAHTYAPSTTR